MVGRVFLLCSAYDTVQEVCAEINRRNLLVNRWDKKPMSLSTVSKSLKTLTEEDLIVERKGVIRLLHPGKLLEKLSENYVTPRIKERIRLKVNEESRTLRKMLLNQSQELSFPLVATGTSSVGPVWECGSPEPTRRPPGPQKRVLIFDGGKWYLN